MPRNACKITAKCLRGTEPNINCGHEFEIGGLFSDILVA